MNKLSKKSIRIGVGILAILILMAGLLVFIGRKYSMRGELETLRIETREMNQDFSEEYQKKDTFSEYSESIRQKKEISREGFIPVEEIKEKLKDLPDNFAEITKGKTFLRLHMEQREPDRNSGSSSLLIFVLEYLHR